MTNVVVVTPSIGKKSVRMAYTSVKQQTMKCDHLLVFDGCPVPGFMRFRGSDPYYHTMILPWNVGGNGFYGHRVYASIAHLVNHDYVLFLDEDNWYRADHVENCVKMLEEDDKLQFVHSLRAIHDSDGEYLLDDNCESLGKYPIYGNPSYGHLVDTSSYCFRRDFLLNYGHIWHHGWGADRRFLSVVMNHIHINEWACTGEYTLCYSLDGNPNSVTRDFFEKGNGVTRQFYKEGYPWAKQ